MKKKLFSAITIISLLMIGFIPFTSNLEAAEISLSETNDVWYTQNGVQVDGSVNSVIVYDSRNQLTRGPVMDMDYYLIYNINLTIRGTGSYANSWSNLGVAFRVDFYKTGSIKSVGTASIYSDTKSGSWNWTSLNVSTLKYTATQVKVTGTGVANLYATPTFSGQSIIQT